MAAALLLLLAVQEPAEGRVGTGDDRHSALRLQVTGGMDLHYLHRHGAVNEAGGGLSAVAPTDASTNAWAGRFSLRLDALVRDQVTGVLELENRSFDEGANEPFSADPETGELRIKQGYVDVPSFLADRLDLRVGIQDVTFRNRPHDEPFFMDLGEVEGFFEGFSAAGSHVRNTVDRDVREAAGVRLRWSPYEVLTLQALALVYGEAGETQDDEAVYVVAASARPAEAGAAWVLLALVSGGDAGPDLKQVWTAGAGADWYFGRERHLEAFAEGYVQGGTVVEEPSRVRKEAYAFNLGARWLGFFEGLLQLEAAVSHRSGNKRAGDRTDESFQSYENENRFLVLQSAEFGLDVDTNVSLARGSLGAGPFDLGGRPLRVRVDVGRFEADRELRDAAGTVLTPDDEWGVETDLLVTWTWNESLHFRLHGGWLAGSAILEDLTLDRWTDTFAAVAGLDFRF